MDMQKKIEYFQSLETEEEKLLFINNHKEAEIIFDIFGGQPNMKKNFPVIYSKLLNSKSQENILFKDLFRKNESDLEAGVFIDLNMQNQNAEVRLWSTITLPEEVQCILVDIMVVYQGTCIVNYKDYVTNASYFNIDKSLKLPPQQAENSSCYIRTILINHDNVYPCVKTRKAMPALGIVNRFELLHPKYKNPNKIIVAFNRRAEEDYYYNYDGGTVPNFILPIKVAIPAVGTDPQINMNNTSVITSRGKLPYLPHTLPKIIQNSNYTTIEFDEQWGWSLDQLPINDLVFTRLFINFGIDYKINSQIYHFNICALSVDKPNPYQGGCLMDIPNLYITWGCLGKDTVVCVRGKGDIPISQIVAGDAVKVQNGDYIVVKNIWEGEEEEIWNIQAKNGSMLQMTIDHPIMTKGGWKTVRELTFTEELLLEDGSYSHMISAYAAPYGDKVFNLELENPQGIIGGGYVVGDFYWQNNLQAERKLCEAKKAVPVDLMVECIQFSKL